MWLYFSEPGCGFSVLLFGSLRKMHIWPKGKKNPQVILSGHKLQQLRKGTLKSSPQRTRAAGMLFHIPLPKEVEERHDAPVDRGRRTQKPMESFYSSLCTQTLHPTAACLLESLPPPFLGGICPLVQMPGPLHSLLLDISAFPCSQLPFLYVLHDVQKHLYQEPHSHHLRYKK